MLMESAPADLDVEGMGRAICGVEGVSSVHDLHVWTVTSGFGAVAAHVVVARGADRDLIRSELEFTLHDRFGIEHTTLQMEEEAEQGLLHVDNAPGGRAGGGARRTLAVRRAPSPALAHRSATPVAVTLPRSARRSGLASLASMPLHRAVATALVTVAAALAALLAAAPASPAADLRSQLEAKESKLDQVRHRKGVLTTTIARDKARIEHLTDEVAAVRTRAAAVRERLAAKQAELGRASAELRTAQSRLDRARAPPEAGADGVARTPGRDLQERRPRRPQRHRQRRGRRRDRRPHRIPEPAARGRRGGRRPGPRAARRSAQHRRAAARLEAADRIGARHDRRRRGGAGQHPARPRRPPAGAARRAGASRGLARADPPPRGRARRLGRRDPGQDRRAAGCKPGRRRCRRARSRKAAAD